MSSVTHLSPQNDAVLAELVGAIAFGQGAPEMTLLVIRCNYAHLREAMLTVLLTRLKTEELQGEVYTLRFAPSNFAVNPSTPSSSPLERGRTGISPLSKGGLRGVESSPERHTHTAQRFAPSNSSVNPATPSSSPLERGRTGISPLSKGD